MRDAFLEALVRKVISISAAVTLSSAAFSIASQERIIECHRRDSGAAVEQVADGVLKVVDLLARLNLAWHVMGRCNGETKPLDTQLLA